MGVGIFLAWQAIHPTLHTPHGRAMVPTHGSAILAFTLLPSTGIGLHLLERKFSMKFALKSLNTLVLAGLLSGVGAAALAQAPAVAPLPPPAAGPMGGPGGGHGMARHDPARMQAWIAQHQADLKAKLKITPAQEAAWSRYTAAMQPPARQPHMTPEQRAEIDKLPTPERIDKMRALRAQRMSEMNAAMDKRDEATKAFYAALSPEQKKTFDAEHPRHRSGSRKGHPEHPHGGMQPMPPAPPRN